MLLQEISIALQGGFHGRSFGALAATANDRYQEPFVPMLDGFAHVRANEHWTRRMLEDPELLETLAGTKFPGEFRATSGLIEHRGPHDRLRPELDASTRRARNPHVAYFLEQNPNYAQGTELACIAEIAPENMRGLARRELLAGMRAARRAA